MSGPIRITLDGVEVEAQPGDTIWQVAHRSGTTIPHLCWRNEPGYRADGNCRACMVEVEGERVLAASCARDVQDGMVVHTATDRARKSREMVFEMLGADMPDPSASADGDAPFWTWARDMGIADRVTGDRLPSKFAGEMPEHDATNPAIAVNLDTCIACNLCVRACREVQVNDVMGMADRGHHTIPVFDLHDPMGHSTCVTCGECVQACPTGALMEKTLLDDANRTRAVPEQALETVKSVCPFCGVGCQTEVSVADGRIVRVDGANGPANENRLCVKGRFGYDYAMSPRRLTKPLIRRDDAPKSAQVDFDGNPMEVFREATWDEAMERAAHGLTTVRDTNGGGAIAGFGSAKGSNEEAYLFQKLIRAGFGTNNVDHCTRLCHASSVSALLEGVGSGAVSAPFMDAHKADCVIVIGARPTVNHPVAATYFKRAAKRGTKFVICDPRGQDMMTHAEHSLRFMPGTDVALLNAMLHVIVAEKLYDQQYIQAHVGEFEALKAKVADFSPEAMADVCGIDADTIREVARLYATSERSMIFWGMGISQHVHGTDNSRCLIALALITGHIGREGTGLHPLRGQNNVQGASDAGLIPMSYPDYAPVTGDARETFEDAWGRPLDPEKGLTVVEVVDAIHEGGIRGMYVMGENPAMSDPDQTHARAAFAKLDHLVVQDIFLTETAWYADVILPASAHAEKQGTFTNTNRQVQMGRPAMALPGDARQDLKIIIDLGRRCGIDWSYDGPAEVFAEMASLMPSLDGITWHMVEREGSVTYPLKGDSQEWVIFKGGFPTPDGRGKLVPVDLLPPDEVPDTDFPMVLTTGRLLEHWHTGAMTRTSSVLDRLEPEAIAAMNLRQIERMGLTPGQTIAIETRRGKITATLRADREVADDMVFVPFCYREAAANILTNPQLDPYGKIPEFKFCAARVSAAGAVAAE
ncbi:formate dehydrogenase subunit alpha [Palleronia abyssalis]|uniref:Formate dehydrogenase n=1 Tax=Palleronia abyssalis TaxID=1501240 RepID=A0A2R8BYM5_9RHOB|nr:formate dehydrogenase subunit alpha [Palleronia abyssalis]SPJ25275.1 Putative formate dehydrogenase [Palleronia abyssalis]